MLGITCVEGSRSATTRSNPRVPLLGAAAMLFLGMASGAAQAGTSGNLSLTSDYAFRGVSQTNEDPALQGGIEIFFNSGAHDSGFYVGAWGSNVSWLSDIPGDISSSLELDGYLGYRGKAGEHVAWDVGVLQYWYPGDYPDGFNSADTTEVYAGVTATPADTLALGLKYSHAVTDLFGYADSDGSGYLDASANWTFAPGWTLNLHAGKQWIESNRDFQYTDWKVGVTKASDSGFSLAAAYTDTDAEEALYTNAYGNALADERVALTLTKTF